MQWRKELADFPLVYFWDTKPAWIFYGTSKIWKVRTRLSTRPSGFPKLPFQEISDENQEKFGLLLYTCERSEYRPFQIFSPSTWPTSLMMGTSNMEGSILKTLLLYQTLWFLPHPQRCHHLWKPYNIQNDVGAMKDRRTRIAHQNSCH